VRNLCASISRCTTRSTKGFEIEFRVLLTEETPEVEWGWCSWGAKIVSARTSMLWKPITLLKDFHRATVQAPGERASKDGNLGRTKTAN
jgi:hypothetical protein